MSHINSTKIILLLALVAVLIQNALTSRIFVSKDTESRNLPSESTNDGTTSSDPDADETLPVYIPADTCPSGYNKRKSGCILKDAKFTIESANGLIHLDSLDNQEVPAHHVVFTVFGMLPESEEKVVVVGMPVEIVPVEAKQHVYALDAATAEVKRTKMKAYDRFRVATNAMGRAAFSFPIMKNEDLRLQKMSVRADFMGVNEWFSFHADTAAITALSKLTSQHLRTANTNISPDEAESNAQVIRTLFEGPAENDNRVYLDEPKQTIALTPSESGSGRKTTSRKLLKKRGDVKDVEKVLDQIKVEAVRTVEIVKEGGRKAIKALIKGSKKIAEVIVTTITTAVKVFLQILKVLGLTAKAVVGVLTVHVKWEDVKATHFQFVNNIYAVHSGISKASVSIWDNFLGGPITRHRQRLDRQWYHIVDDLRIAIHPRSRTGPGGVNQYTYIADLIVSIGDHVKFKNVDPAVLRKLIESVQIVKEQIINRHPNLNEHPEIMERITKVEQNLEAVKTRGLNVKIVNALFGFVKFLYSGVLALVYYPLCTVGVGYALLVEGLFAILQTGVYLENEAPREGHEGHVARLGNLKLKLPEEDIEGPNGERYVSLLSLLVLPTSYLYTVGYMLTHSGRPPYPKTPQVALPSTFQQTKTNLIRPPPHDNDATTIAPQSKEMESGPSVPPLKDSESEPSVPNLKNMDSKSSTPPLKELKTKPWSAPKLEDLWEPKTPSGTSEGLLDLQPSTSASESDSDPGLNLLDRRRKLVRRGSSDSFSPEIMAALIEAPSWFAPLGRESDNIFGGIGILEVIAAMGSAVSESKDVTESGAEKCTTL
ncbi:hypothetical protein HK102_012401 [Quaeritorhiza haematococci]|nr:hypothetical protein HK102_012401 [Quaeritorhiza haematococci]